MVSNISFAFLFRDVVVSNLARAGKKIKAGHRGSVLISLLVTMAVLSALGAAMLPLFSSSTMSSVASNDARKALYMAESGLRYALSELRNSGFSRDVIEGLNVDSEGNIKVYSLSDSDGGSFAVNVFKTEFESESEQILSAGQTLALTTRFGGKMPEGFSIPVGTFVVNLKSFRDAVVFGGDPEAFTAEVQNFQRVSDTSLTLSLNDAFNVSKDDLVCLAVRPFSSQNGLIDGSDLEVDIEAKDFFPKQNGSIYVSDVVAKRVMNYFYDERIDDIPGSRVRLTNLSAPTAVGFPFSVNLNTDYVILSGSNYRIIPTGYWGEDAAAVSYAISGETATSASDESLPDPTESSPDFSPQEVVDSLSALESSPGQDVIVVDKDSGEITLGGGVGDAFGAVWFGGNNNIGGIADFCTDGKCQFNYGVRTFFKLYYNGEGDGFTLAFINGEDNDKSSVGGDAGAGELMAYAGDSRTASVGPVGFYFLDGAGYGLRSPKMALEFDTYTNADNNPLCSGTAFKTFQSGQRNDPLSSGKDVLQYVFWGSTDGWPCRTNAAGDPSPTYDDNRHDTNSGGNPPNIKINSCTYGDRLIAEGVTVDNTTDWLNGSSSKPWAVRVEVIRGTEPNAGGKYEYTLKTWIRQCNDLNCDNIDGTYFADTSIEYGAQPPHLLQTVELSADDHGKFDTFLFGLTEATGGAVQTATISNLQLSFIRPGDAVIGIGSDPSWP